MSPASPKPLIISLAPSAAKALAIERPMPEVEPVTNATLPLRNICDSPWRIPRGASGELQPPPVRSITAMQQEGSMRFGDERESGNFEDATGRSGLGFGGGGGGGLGCLIPLVASRFGIGGVVVLLIGYFLLSSLGGLGGGGGSLVPGTQQSAPAGQSTLDPNTKHFMLQVLASTED